VDTDAGIEEKIPFDKRWGGKRREKKKDCAAQNKLQCREIVALLLKRKVRVEQSAEKKNMLEKNGVPIQLDWEKK